MRCQYAIFTTMPEADSKVELRLSSFSSDSRSLPYCRYVLKCYQSDPTDWNGTQWVKRPEPRIARLPDKWADRELLLQMLSLIQPRRSRTARKSYIVMEALSGLETGVYAVRALRRTIRGCDAYLPLSPLICGLYHVSEGGDVDFAPPSPREEDLWCEDE